MNSVSKALLRHQPTRWLARGAVAAFALSILAVALLPTAGEAKPVGSKISATVFGTIDSHGTVAYYFSGYLSASNFTFRCMEGRKVALFRVGPKGEPRKVATAETKLFGKFLGGIEKPLSTIAGYYFVKVEPKIRHTRRGRLRCLAARSPTFLVEVPDGLSD